ncbi:MAG: M3 family peptidase, partial [Pseudoalteromonas spongiae]
MKLKISLLSAAVVVALAGCSSTETNTQTETVVQKVEKQYDNILLQKYAGPYEGVPQFDKVTIADLEPALDVAIAENLAEIDAIANNPEKPTFQNTIVALEASGSALDRLFPYYGIWANNNSSPAFRELQGKLLPKFSEMSSKITQNKALFERIQAVYKSDEFKNLTAEEQRITWMRYNGFARNGAT